MKSVKYLLTLAAVLGISGAFAQGLLNKLKNAATQEINKASQKTWDPSQPNKLSANVTRTVVVSLSGEENFDYSENCIDLGSSMNQTSFIITKGRGDQAKCFNYKNGVRTPVSCPTSSGNCGSLQCSYYKLREINQDTDEFKKYVTLLTEEHKVEQPAISDQQMKMMSAYMTKEQLEAVKKQMAEAAKQTENKTYSTVKGCIINFNGKKYGQYRGISQFYLTPDGKHFYAIVTEDSENGFEIRYRIITSASETTLVTTSQNPPMKLLVTPDNSEFAILNMSLDMKFTFMTSSGKTQNIANGTGIEDAWYSPAGNHIIHVTQNELYRDGLLVKTFEPYTKPQSCDMFINSDGKGVTVVKDNIISFADGDVFKYPLKVAVVNVGGKNYFKWLALEDREVVVYQKPY